MNKFDAISGLFQAQMCAIYRVRTGLHQRGRLCWKLLLNTALLIKLHINYTQIERAHQQNKRKTLFFYTVA